MAVFTELYLPMYQAIITEAFAELLQRYKGDFTKVPVQEAPYIKPLVDLIHKGAVSLEPVFPGVTDPQMNRFYKVSLPKELSPAEQQQLRSNPAFEGFYEKPADELPL